MKALLCPLLMLLPVTLAAEPPSGLLTERWRYAQVHSSSGPETLDYLLGLGAFQKVRSRWRLDESDVIRGDLQRITWQVEEGFTAEEGYEWYRAKLPDDAELLFECEGRACGSSAQWANRIFEQRILYGHDDRQRYGVWRVSSAKETWTLVLYAVDRANRRHFVHLDRLRHIADVSEPDDAIP
jgi:hypothetical protein